MKTMITSITSFLAAFMLFFAVVFAWFSLSDQSGLQLVDIVITEGISYDYEIRYYTNEYIYKYDQSTQSIKVYNTQTSSWVLPNQLPGNPEYLLDGVFISQYDVYIPENNHKNNLIIEVIVNFSNQEPLNIVHRLVSDASLSSSVIQSMNLNTSRAYYVSEVANIQTMLTNQYNHLSDTFNKYETLTTAFNQRDGSNNYIYPQYSFYHNNVYQPSINLGSSAIGVNSTLRFYYNVSYDASRVTAFHTNEFHAYNVNINDIPFVLFFQDIKISLMGGTN
jgi:hypothetical protein